MRSSLRILLSRESLTPSKSVSVHSLRHASLTGAINRGIRKTRKGTLGAETRSSEKGARTSEWPDNPFLSEDRSSEQDTRASKWSPLSQEPRSVSPRRRHQNTDLRQPDYYDRPVENSKRGRERSNERTSHSESLARAGKPVRDREGNQGGRYTKQRQDFTSNFSERRARAQIRGEDEFSMSKSERHKKFHESTHLKSEERSPPFSPGRRDGVFRERTESSWDAERRVRRDTTDDYKDSVGFHKSRGQSDTGPRRTAEVVRHRRFETRESSSTGDSSRVLRHTGEDSKSEEAKPFAKNARPHVKVPLSIPYTTAGSEFLYGTFVVKAALRSGRRKLYKLYIYEGADMQGEDQGRGNAIHKLALAAGVSVSKVTGDWERLLYKMSDQRPHNGYVLEASPLPKLPITVLERLQDPAETFDVVLGHQSAEDLAVNSTFAIEGSTATLPSVAGLDRFPLILLLDSIKDTGNLGAIIRSAYFLGVDALVLLEHNTAPLSPIVLKTSAGAAEYLPVLTVKNEHSFVKLSQQKGWKFLVATSPDSSSGLGRARKSMSMAAMASVLKESPCVLMLGSEGEGARPHLQKLADGSVGIESARGPKQGLDSLNVSVAAALLIQQFLGGTTQGLAGSVGIPAAKASQALDGDKLF